MRTPALLTCLGCLALAPLVLAGPLDGPRTFSIRVEAGHQTAGGELVPGRVRFPVEFRGGERACVVAVGDHKPPVEMGITVYDEAARQKLAEDTGAGDAPDFVAAIWYPARDGKYVIEIRSKGKEYNEVTVTVR